MDYSALAEELLEKMQLLHKAKSQRDISDALQGEAFVLSYIARQGGGVLPGEIGHVMDVSSARIAQTLGSIEKKGWVTRRIDPGDRRKIIVKLTPEGRAEAEKHRRAVTGLAVEMLRLMGERDAAEYVRITGKLADAVSAGADRKTSG